MSEQVKTAPIGFVEDAVRERYGAGAQAVEPALCCPVMYDPKYLAAIPDEVIERDYGCGDPTPYVRTGDTVPGPGRGRRKDLLHRGPGRGTDGPGHRRGLQPGDARTLAAESGRGR